MKPPQANEVAEKAKRMQVNADHVFKALGELGFGDFVPELRAYWEEWKAESKASGQRMSKAKTLAAQSGLTEEEQMELQKKMFAAAAARSTGGGGGAGGAGGSGGM